MEEISEFIQISVDKWRYDINWQTYSCL